MAAQQKTSAVKLYVAASYSFCKKSGCGVAFPSMTASTMYEVPICELQIK